MKKALNIYLMTGDTKEKLNMAKKTGFDGVFLGVYDKNETISLEEQVEYCKEIGLGISMIHCSYIEPMLNDFWLENEKGDEVEKSLISQIERIKDLGVKDFVIHTNGGFDVKNSQTGLQRIKNILKICEKYDINLCIENLYVASQVSYIFENIKHPNLKFCYDCGHENFLTPGCDLVKNYHNLVTVSHLHDNFGKKDEHQELGKGSIDLNRLAKLLSTCKDMDYISAEVKYTNPTKSMQEIYTDVFNALEMIDEKINNITNEKIK